MESILFRGQSKSIWIGLLLMKGSSTNGLKYKKSSQNKRKESQ